MQQSTVYCSVMSRYFDRMIMFSDSQDTFGKEESDAV